MPGWQSDPSLLGHPWLWRCHGLCLGGGGSEREGGASVFNQSQFTNLNMCDEFWWLVCGKWRGEQSNSQNMHLLIFYHFLHSVMSQLPFAGMSTHRVKLNLFRYHIEYSNPPPKWKSLSYILYIKHVNWKRPTFSHNSPTEIEMGLSDDWQQLNYQRIPNVWRSLEAAQWTSGWDGGAVQFNRATERVLRVGDNAKRC